MFDVAVIGYGPVGSIMANLIAIKGHKVLIIDANKVPVLQLEQLIQMANNVVPSISWDSQRKLWRILVILIRFLSQMLN